MTDAAATVAIRSVIASGARPYAVLKDVSFTVAPGEVLGVVGESGSGIDCGWDHGDGDG